jgi:hypothetical protein
VEANVPDEDEAMGCGFTHAYGDVEALFPPFAACARRATEQRIMSAMSSVLVDDIDDDGDASQLTFGQE